MGSDAHMSEPSTPRSRLLAVTVVAAPVLLLASTITYVGGGGLGDDSAGGAIQVYAATAFTLAIIALTGRLAPAMPRLRHRPTARPACTCR